MAKPSGTRLIPKFLEGQKVRGIGALQRVQPCEDRMTTGEVLAVPQHRNIFARFD